MVRVEEGHCGSIDIERLSVAKRILGNYPLLNTIFNSFVQYEHVQYAIMNNKVFRMCMPKPKPNFLLEEVFPIYVPDSIDLQLLDKLENGISIVKGKIGPSAFDKLIDRLTSDNYFKSEAAIAEIIIPYLIGEQIGHSNVYPQHGMIGGKKPDILVANEGTHREIYLEITGLGERPSEKKIKEIFRNLAKHVQQKCVAREYYVLIHIDTLNLRLDKENNFDVQKSTETLREFADRLRLHDLAGVTGRIYLRGYYPTADKEIEQQYLIDLVEKRCGSGLLYPELDQMIKLESTAKDWAREIKFTDLCGTPFESVSYFKSPNSQCVIVDSLEVDSDAQPLSASPILESARAVKSAFVDHIKRRINDKYTEKQFVEGNPFVILVRAQQWRFSFEESYDDFIPLEKEIQKELFKYPSLSGVLVYSSYYYKGRYVENKAATQYTSLSAQELKSFMNNLLFDSC